MVCVTEPAGPRGDDSAADRRRAERRRRLRGRRRPRPLLRPRRSPKADDTSVVRLRTARGVSIAYALKPCALPVRATAAPDGVRAVQGRPVPLLEDRDVGGLARRSPALAAPPCSTSLLDHLGHGTPLLAPLDGVGAVADGRRGDPSADPAARRRRDYLGRRRQTRPTPWCPALRGLAGAGGTVARRTFHQARRALGSSPLLGSASWRGSAWQTHRWRFPPRQRGQRAIGESASVPRRGHQPGRRAGFSATTYPGTTTGTSVSPWSHLRRGDGTNFWGGRTFRRPAGYVWLGGHGAGGLRARAERRRCRAGPAARVAHRGEIGTPRRGPAPVLAAGGLWAGITFEFDQTPTASSVLARLYPARTADDPAAATASSSGQFPDCDGDRRRDRDGLGGRGRTVRGPRGSGWLAWSARFAGRPATVAFRPRDQDSVARPVVRAAARLPGGGLGPRLGLRPPLVVH